MENFGVASVTTILVHQIITYLINECVILKVQRMGLSNDTKKFSKSRYNHGVIQPQNIFPFSFEFSENT